MNFWQDFVQTQQVLNSDQYVLKLECLLSEQEEKPLQKKILLKLLIRSLKATKSSVLLENTWFTIDCLRILFILSLFKF